jgi:hypothetical protein
LFGIEIDERAGELAAFALTMKARAKHRRFFNKGIKPNICVLGNVEWEVGSEELGVGSGEFLGVRVEGLGVRLEDLLHDLRLFGEANNFGSLLRPRLSSVQVESVRLALTNHWSLIPNPSLFDNQTHEKVLRVLRQADFLSSKYHVVIANPPYMGGKGMNNRMSAWVKDNYPDSKSDLFAMFMERNLELAVKNGLVAMVTMQSWMFLSSFEKLREKLIAKQDIATLIQIGYNSFPDLNSKVVQACAFVLVNSPHKNFGAYINLNDAPQSADKEFVFIEKKKNNLIYRASVDDFKKIPSSAIAYWVSPKILALFEKNTPLETVADIRVGLDTGNNDLYIKSWNEVNFQEIGFDYNSTKDFLDSGKLYVPHTKGGSFRKWYGNNEHILKFDISSYQQLENSGNHLPSRQFYFREGGGYTRVSSSLFSIRYTPNGFVFNSASPTLFCETTKALFICLGLLSSKLTTIFVSAMSPTLNFQAGEIRKIPFVVGSDETLFNLLSHAIQLSKIDWDSYENSWDFKTLPLLHTDYLQSTLEATYTQLRQYWQQTTSEMERLEEENNRIFIEAYGLQDELTPEVPLKEITLTCNPHYRYDSNKSEAELETLLLADTIREFISYAVGCIFGRYSLDKEGLILANQGETIEDYLQKIPNPSFMPDRDNVIPIIEGDWFTDDISEQFRKFLRLTFGEENYQTNLTFIEKALDKPIQKYFLKDFYNDHVKRYKKRPIYWLFSSPKGNFNALIYLHRYRPDTASIVLNDYLREYRAKLTAHKTHLEAVSIDQNATQSEKTKALKTIENLRKIIDELGKYERDILYPLASQQLAIDLDDGVKVNYVKFGAALKKIAGLDATDD